MPLRGRRVRDLSSHAGNKDSGEGTAQLGRKGSLWASGWEAGGRQQGRGWKEVRGSKERAGANIKDSKGPEETEDRGANRQRPGEGVWRRGKQAGKRG